MIYSVLLILIIILGFVIAYQSESDSQDCTQYCTHWVHENRSRWRHNIKLNDEDTIRERIGLFYSVVEWRRSLIITIIITILLCIVMCIIHNLPVLSSNSLKLFVLAFVYVFIAIFFISMYYQDLWYRAMLE